MSENKKVAILFGFVAVIILLVYAIGVEMEARTFRKLTGKDVTFWDALWVDLKVIDAPAK